MGSGTLGGLEKGVESVGINRAGSANVAPWVARAERSGQASSSKHTITQRWV